MSDTFDFGFTAVTEDELEVVQNVAAKAEESQSEIERLTEKLTKLRNAIEPLLSNLEANPEKSYIHWPDRTAKVKAFRGHLDKIMKS
jgi:signal transduction protein with GAF and PtsI domain